MTQGMLFEVYKMKRNQKGEKFYWLACSQCGRERWVPVRCLKRKNFTGLCQKCSGLRRRKGGRIIKPDGYILVKLRAEDFFYPMAGKDGYIREHRLVMAKHLNRCLLPWEIVHHKGTKYPQGSKEDKADNRIENLALFTSQSRHLPSIMAKGTFNRLKTQVEAQGKRITLLEAENVALRKALIEGNLIQLVIPD